MGNLDRRFYIRCDENFLTEIDEWRKSRRPIPSRGAAIRELASRGSAAETCLPAILSSAMHRLAANRPQDYINSPDAIERLKEVVVRTLDFAAQVRHLSPDDALRHLQTVSIDPIEFQEKTEEGALATEFRRSSR